MTDNSKRSANEAMDNFTRAVKTIVNVPKDSVPKHPAKPTIRKIDDKYEEWTCPDCGTKFIRPTKHSHKD